MMFFSCVLTIFMLAVLVYDTTSYLIPNWLVGVMLALYPVFLLMTPIMPDWKMALVAGIGTFGLGFIFFNMNWMGGGDVKLMSVCALWCGYPAVIDFLVGVGVLGGLLALFLLFARPGIDMLVPQSKLPRIFKKGEAIPYGVAISGAFLGLLWTGGVPGLALS